MEANGIVLVGAAGVQAQAMLKSLSRALDLSGLTAVDLSWGDEARAEMETLGVEVVSGDVLSDDRELLTARRRDVSLLVNMAGPFYVIGTAALELAIELGADYLDICDDVDATELLLALQPEARTAGIRALIGMGSAPGTTNILIRTALDALEDPRRAAVELAWTVDRADMARAAFDHVIHCFATALPGVLEVPEWEDLKPRYLEFPDPVGRQVILTLGHPEPLTLPRFTGVGQITNQGGISPPEYLHLCWALARQCDLKALQREGVDAALYGQYCSFEKLHGPEAVRYGSGLQIDVTIDGDGYRFAGGSDMKMEEATGVPAAAGVLLMLRQALAEPGVWAPECLKPRAFFEELRRVSTGGGGLHLLLLREGQPAGRARIRDLLGD